MCEKYYTLSEERNYEKLQDARFDGWLRSVYGDNWMMLVDEDIAYDQFQDFLDRCDDY
jgi:hypothetical protein